MFSRTHSTQKQISFLRERKLRNMLKIREWVRLKEDMTKWDRWSLNHSIETLENRPVWIHIINVMSRKHTHLQVKAMVSLEHDELNSLWEHILIYSICSLNHSHINIKHFTLKYILHNKGYYFKDTRTERYDRSLSLDPKSPRAKSGLY